MKGKDELIDLLQKIARGDEQAFRQFYDLTSAHLFGVALKLLKAKRLGRGCDPGSCMYESGITPANITRGEDPP